MSTEPNTGLTYQEPGSLQTDALQNELVNYLGVWLNCAVQSVGDTVPPGSPVNGDRYIVGTSATGAWATHDDKLAVYRGGWTFYAPGEGVTVHNLGDGADWINEGSGGWAVKAGGGGIPEAPIDGQQYARKDAGWVVVTGGGGGDFEKIAQVIVTGSAVTDIDFAGLDLDADSLYQLEVYCVPGTTGGHVVGLYYNADTTAANYQTQLGYVVGGSSGGLLQSAASVFSTNTLAATTEPFSFTAKIMKAAGSKPNARASGVSIDTGGAPYISEHAHRWNSTANVTALKLRNSISSGFGIGSFARLYRKN